jgi:putative phage-type endonuclease
MKSNLKIYRIPEHTDEWFAFRRNGIGGSEVATILGLNKYDTVIRTFHEKVGTIDFRKDDNAAMFWGRELEDKIAEIWKFYDGTATGYIENRKNNRIVRECRNINGYIVNPKYPWLFGSLDRVMNIQGGLNLITKEPLTTEAVLECKGLSYWASQIWTDGIPVSYLAQIHLYMIILETDYAELAILQDGNQFRVEKYQRDEALCDSIINITKAFWENRVLPAKEAFKKKQMAELQGNIYEVEKYEAVIQRHEPDPDMSEAYKDFMEERFLKEREIVEGNMDHYVLCQRDAMLRKLVARMAKERVGIRNILLKVLSRYGVDTIDFGKLGTVTWAERKGRKRRTFTIRIKENPPEDKVEYEFSKIKQTW